MNILKEIDQIRTVRWADPLLTWGLVPTMGTLHEGHLALVRRARADNDRVVVSIFVNPIQFNNPADLAAYPRQLDKDIELLLTEGVDLVWAPNDKTMYPDDFQSYVTVEQIARSLEGAARPGHFKGVTTVVAKLFNVCEPTRAYFGQKDAQQVATIKQMVYDLGFNIDVIACPIVREPDGLAMSSRNVRLNAEERQAALVLSKALQAASVQWGQGNQEAAHLRQTMHTIIDAEPLARADYVSVAHPNTLQELEGTVESALISLAVFIGEIRLIDNILINV